MHFNHNIRTTLILIICLTPILTESTKKHTSKTDSSDSTFSGDSSTLNGKKKSNIVPEYVREHDIPIRWVKMEWMLKTVFVAFHNVSFPFFSRISNDLDISPICKRDIATMWNGLKNFKSWAGQMFDSLGKFPIGLTTGTLNALGDYDQCLNVELPGRFQGQYCNMDVIMPLPKREPYVSGDTEIPELLNLMTPNGFLSVFAKHGRFTYFINPRFSLCVPSTCSKEELQKIAKKAVHDLDLPFGVHIPNCEVLNQEVKFDRTEITIMIILGFVLFLVISATAVEVYIKSTEAENGKSNLSLPTKYLLCFSLYSNTKRLLRSETEKDSIKIFHGMRVLTTLWVIMVHTCYYQNLQASGSLLFLHKSSQKMYYQFVANGFVNVQIFFFMSGALHAFRVMKMKEELSVTKHIFRRIWRLAPAFMFVIACAIMTPRLGSGPVYKETVGGILGERCRANWWTNLLFVNNFIANDEMCLQWLWYIPVDFQLYIISLLVLIPMKRNPKLAFTINFLIMIVGMVISAVCHIYYNLTPMLTIAFSHPEDLSYFLERGYFRTYLHCSSVCVGLAVGYFLVNKPAKLRIPWKISAPLWIASYAIFFTVILCVHQWSQGHLPSIYISALYAGGSKILWAAGMTWVTIACMTGNGGIINKLLSLPIFVPLGRLCYMVYLIHSIIHYMYIGSTRVSIRIDPRTLGYMFCGTVFISFMCAFVLTLVFESPFTALDKLMFSEKTSEKAKRTKKLENGQSEGVLKENGNIVESTKRNKKVA